MDSNTYEPGKIVTVLGNSRGLARTGYYVFAGWTRYANGNGLPYPGGGAFAMGRKNLMLYAKWVIPPGTARWARSVTSGTNHSMFQKVATDSSGNVYAAGYQDGNTAYTYGSESVTGAFWGDNAVIVKYAQ